MFRMYQSKKQKLKNVLNRNKNVFNFLNFITNLNYFKGLIFVSRLSIKKLLGRVMTIPDHAR